MQRVAVGNGKVSHIPADFSDGADGRTVTTACGKVFAEFDLHVDTELDECSACNSKLESSVEDAPDTELP